MKEPEFIGNKLSLQCHAASVGIEHGDDYRVRYTLHFREKCGFDWIETQVNKVSRKFNTDLQMWKIESSDMFSFSISVKEVEKRFDIENDQESLKAFEKS